MSAADYREPRPLGALALVVSGRCESSPAGGDFLERYKSMSFVHCAKRLRIARGVVLRLIELPFGLHPRPLQLSQRLPLLRPWLCLQRP